MLYEVITRKIDELTDNHNITKELATLFKPGYQGIFPGSQFSKTGLPPALFAPDGFEFYA